MANESKYPIDKFLEEVLARKEDRGFLAELKCGTNENLQARAWPHIAHQGFDFTDTAKRKIWLTIGGLTALLVNSELVTSDWSTIGTVMRKIKGGDSKSNENGLKTYEAKFRRVLNCSDSNELCDVVISIVRTAERKNIKVNCRQLFWDLCDWDNEVKREKVRVRWARDFYGVINNNESDQKESEQ